MDGSGMEQARFVVSVRHQTARVTNAGQTVCIVDRAHAEMRDSNRSGEPWTVRETAQVHGGSQGRRSRAKFRVESLGWIRLQRTDHATIGGETNLRKGRHRALTTATQRLKGQS